MKKLTVTIGIPAYNEEANIYCLLTCLIHQSEKGIEIQKIIVINDGSQDGTVSEIRKIKDKRILLINNASRKGQTFCQNLIFSRVRSDVVVLLEADTKPRHSNYIELLVAPIRKGEKIGLVQGNIDFAKPVSLVGRVIEMQASIYHSFQTSNSNGVIFCSGRGGRAFTRRVYNDLRWPSNVPEDTYAALWCKERSIRMVFVKRAKSLFRVPESVVDFYHARLKVATGHIALEKYFSVSEIRSLYNGSNEEMLMMFVEFMLKKPMYCIAYIFLKMYAEKISFNKNFSDYWEIGRSTKFVLVNSPNTSRL